MTQLAKKRIRIIGVPLDLGAGRRGVDMGPSALRVAGIDARLAALGHDVEDLGDLTVTVPETVSCGRTDLRFIDAVLSVNRALAQSVREILAAGCFPLILGGDHSIAIGTIAGSSTYFLQSTARTPDARQSAPLVRESLEAPLVRESNEAPLVRESLLAPDPAGIPSRTSASAPPQSKIQDPNSKIGSPLGVIWLDAHADMNTPQTTPTGNIHGMCLASLLGLGDERLVNVGQASGVGQDAAVGRVSSVGQASSVGRVSNPSLYDGFPNPSGVERVSNPSTYDGFPIPSTPDSNPPPVHRPALLGLGDERLVDVGRISNPSDAGSESNVLQSSALRTPVEPSSPRAKISGRHVALVGVRDIDPGERDHLRSTGVRVFTMREIDERGMAAVMTDAIRVASAGTAGIHLQLDMDALDPEVAPGTGTPVPGGLSYREAHLAMEMLADAANLVAIDVVEINPIMGHQNQTAELAVELVLSALGKRIL